MEKNDEEETITEQTAEAKTKNIRMTPKK